MCLSRVDFVKIDPKDTKWKIGYKVFVKNGAGFCNSILQQHPSFKLHKVNIDPKKDQFIYSLIWRNLSESKLTIPYPNGYHIFEELIPATNYAISSNFEMVFKVKYRKVVARGTEGDKIKVIVAQEMTIEEMITQGE
jgi:hypothetical protein